MSRSANLRTQLRRARALAARYRVDGRLPPVVGELVTHRARQPLKQLKARLVKPRSVRTVGVLDRSTRELGVANVTVVIEAMNQGGAVPFVVERRGDRFRVGLIDSDRRIAVAAVGHLVERGWLVVAERGSRRRMVDSTAQLRHLRRATRWTIFQPRALGDEAIGEDQGVELGFYAPGTSGQLELIGTRGQERFHDDSPVTTVMVNGISLPSRAAFAVTHNLHQFDEPIDVVYTWVDNSDPAWRERFDECSMANGRGTVDSMSSSRFRSNDELRYSLRSVALFAGWVRHVYVVTAGQRPPWLVENDRLTVVDHRQILQPQHLPTFNSHAIESALHHIPGLAEHWIYFNDDVLLGRPVQPEQFFTSSGLPYVFASDARVHSVQDSSTGGVDIAARRGNELLHAAFGRVAAYKPLHTPHPQRRSTLIDIEQRFAADIDATRNARFRSSTDISLASSFGPYYGVATGTAVLGHIGHDYVSLASPRLAWSLDRLSQTRGYDTFCVNDSEVPPHLLDRNGALLAAFLRAYFPLASRWESADG